MAVKKTQLYASLWASCDKLRGGMDSSEYKDYILTLLFMKYVTDKFKNKGAYEDIKVFDKAHDKDPDPEKRTGCSFDDFIALKGKKNIGEGMDKIIARLADENTDLKGVIDIAHFNDEKKLGSGKEMVDKLTDLISIFQRPELDFSRNKAEGENSLQKAERARDNSIHLQRFPESSPMSWESAVARTPAPRYAIRHVEVAAY